MRAAFPEAPRSCCEEYHWWEAEFQSAHTQSGGCIQQGPASRLAGPSRRLHGLVHDVDAHSLLSGTQPVTGNLLRHHQQGRDAEAARIVTLPTSKSKPRTYVTPEHFAGILRQLIDEKLIRVDAVKVNILDVARLRSVGA